MIIGSFQVSLAVLRFANKFQRAFATVGLTDITDGLNLDPTDSDGGEAVSRSTSDTTTKNLRPYRPWRSRPRIVSGEGYLQSSLRVDHSKWIASRTQRYERCLTRWTILQRGVPIVTHLMSSRVHWLKVN